jgi:dihydrofolate reductase
MADLSIVAAVARNGVIGRDGRLPWHLPADLKYFRALTTGHAVIMGRKTYESILESLGRPLPQRSNIVITRTAGYQAQAAIVVPSLEAAVAQIPPGREGFVIGGAEIYRLALPHVKRLHMTELDKEYAGDTLFPDFDRGQWREESRETGADGDLRYSFVTYQRV